MQPVQIALTDDLALKARLALDHLLADEEHVQLTDEERADFERLAVIFGQVATHPEQFKPTGRLAARIKKVGRRVQGPAQPQSHRNKRKARQERRQRYHKWRRRERKALAEMHNRAMEQYERERQEMEAFYRAVEERIASQPKFQIKDIHGNIVLSDIPAEAILNAEGEPAFPQSKIVVAR